MSLVNHLASGSHKVSMAAVVIDFEGFQTEPHSFIIKELAFFSVSHGYHGRWCFLPPHSWEQLPFKKQKTYAWLTRFCHGMHWNSGDLPYAALRMILLSIFASYTDIYVKGMEKCKFLEKLSGRRIFDLNDLTCPKMVNLEEKYSVSCPIHARRFKHCALAKAAAYASFL